MAVACLRPLRGDAQPGLEPATSESQSDTLPLAPPCHFSYYLNDEISVKRHKTSSSAAKHLITRGTSSPFSMI